MIKNLLFDLGNVLLDIDERITEDWLKEHLDPQKSSDLMNQVLHPFERGEISEEAFFNRLQRRSKKVLEGSLYYKAWNAMLIGMPERRFHFLHQLRSQYKVYLLSNINITHYRAVKQLLLRQNGIPHFEEYCFDKTYYSFEIGRRKPDASCFEYVLSDSGITGHETLFIDDKIENTQTAARLGLQVHHHNPEEEIIDIVTQLLSTVNGCITVQKT